MKTIYRLIAITLPVLVIAISCSEELMDEVVAPQSIEIPFTASVQQAEKDLSKATIDNETNKQLLFESGDQLVIEGTNISGTLTINEGVGLASATFTGTLTYTGEGSPAEDLTLTASLISAANSLTGGEYSSAIAPTLAEAVQKYSNLTGASTYSAGSFALSQGSAFVKFTLTSDFDSVPDGTYTATVSDQNGTPYNASGSVTFTSGTSSFVVAFLGGIDLSKAKVTINGVDVKFGAASQTLVANNVYTVTKPISKYTNLSASATANCYIVPSQGGYKFAATVKGNGAADLSGVSKSTDAASISNAGLIWATFNTAVAPVANELIQGISYHNGYVYFSTGDTYKAGNALVAIRDASSNILWSWHLWFTPDDLEALAQTYPTSGYKVLDRNLGALTNHYEADNALDFGFAYQRGRKDPFMMSASRTSYSALGVLGTYTSSAGSSNVASSILRPTVVFGTDSWGGTGNLWLGDGGSKTIFDPCPPGWKVAPGNIWSSSGFNASTCVIYNGSWSTYHGRMFNGEAWFPATGDRWGANHNNTGSNICVWTSGTGSTILYDQNGGSFSITAAANPGHGFSVRCVKE